MPHLASFDRSDLARQAPQRSARRTGPNNRPRTSLKQSRHGMATNEARATENKHFWSSGRD